VLEHAGVQHTGEIRPDVATIDRLLARDPTPPRRRPAGAVHLRAAQRDERVEHVALTVDLDRDGAALGERVVAGGGIAEDRIGVVRRLRWLAGVAVDLVVAHDDRAPVAAAERGHPVVAAGQHRVVAEHGPPRVEAAVLEAGRQREPDFVVAQVRHWRQRPVTVALGPVLSVGDEALERSRHRQADAGGGASLEQRPSSEIRHGQSSP
jgi:hypothetical protein